MLLGYARLAKALINKKENFLMKSLFFNLDYKNKFNYLLKPINEFEKQFLFKKPLYDNIINEAKVQTTFIKNSYNLGRNSGINYYTRGDLVLENKDIKDPLFYVRENYIINKYIMCDNFFCLDINKHIFFFLLIDFYKILVVIYLYKLINF
jgi:hypothetical protein